MSPSWQSSQLPSETSSTPACEATAAAAERDTAASRRSCKELDNTEPAALRGDLNSDGRCEEPRMRSPVFHNTNVGCCWSAPHRWVETQNRPTRLICTETKLDNDYFEKVESGAITNEGCENYEDNEEHVTNTIQSEDEEAQDLRYHSVGKSSNVRSPDSTGTNLKSNQHERLIDGYEDTRVYLVHVLFLDWRDLPGRRSNHSSERVWVLGASDREGRHRTRLLVVGREWRPKCLEKVNMINQPVVYAGGGSGSITAELFLWWFRHEFIPTAMAMHPDGVVLVAEQADYLPSEEDCIIADGLVRLVSVPKYYVEPKLVANELRTKLAVFLLLNALSEAGMNFEKNNDNVEETTKLNGFTTNLEEYIKKFSLKEAFAELHRAWLTVRPDTFSRCWKKKDKDFIGPSTHMEENKDDSVLIKKLRQLSLEARMDIKESDVQNWLLDKESEYVRCIKKSEPGTEEEAETSVEDKEEIISEPAPSAREVVDLLSRVLAWMEAEPLDPGFLLAVRAMRATATLMASKMGLTGTHPSGLPFFCPNGDHLTQPPPAHMGIPPYGALDAGKAAAAAGLTRAPMYPFSTGQYPYPMLSPEMTQVAASWHTPSMYPISPASAGFRSPYPTSLPITSSSLPSDLYRFSPTGLMPPHPGLSPHAHALASHALVSSAPKADHSTLDHNHRSTIEQKNSTSLPAENTKNQDTGQQNNQDKKKPHIKKPLNAFMLYMKEMRAKVVAECTLKESAAINQILGRRWHALGRDEQAKYYELARRERQLHMQLYPDWSSRANTNRTKKRKRKQDTNSDPGGNNMKKCRARFGLDQQSQWCKPCRRKKKCIRYMGEGGDGDGDGEAEDEHSEDNLGSVGEAGTPEDDESLSSPGALSGLSSLASPSLVLPSPSSLASPCPLTPPVLIGPSIGQQQHQPRQHDQQQQHQQQPATPHRNPVGTNPHDINNPLSVNQLTGQCIKTEPGHQPSNPAISVT